MPGLEVAGDAVDRADASLEQAAERDVLAERHEVPLGVGALDRTVGPVQHVEVQGLGARGTVALGGRVGDRVGEHPRVVPPRHRGEVRSEERVGPRIGVHARLGEDDQVDGIVDLGGQREVAAREVAVTLLGGSEVAVLIVALKDRDAQRSRGRWFGPDRGRDEGQHEHCREAGGEQRPSAAVRSFPSADRAECVGEEAVERDREERDECEAAVACERPTRDDVVKGIADLAPREPAQRSSRDRRFGQHPHGGDDERARGVAPIEPANDRARGRPVQREDGDERDNCNGAEVPRPRQQPRVVRDRGDERVARGGAGSAAAPRDEQRD